MADAQATATAVKGVIGKLGGGFMISREAKAASERAGLAGRAMYFRGRCGVLGEVDADVVRSAVAFFPAGHVRANWEAGRSLPVDKAVELYAEACHAWGRRRLGAFGGAARLAELLERVAAEAEVAGARSSPDGGPYRCRTTPRPGRPSSCTCCANCAAACTRWRCWPKG